jgi:hypothetical protein
LSDLPTEILPELIKILSALRDSYRFMARTEIKAKEYRLRWPFPKSRFLINVPTLERRWQFPKTPSSFKLLEYKRWLFLLQTEQKFRTTGL